MAALFYGIFGYLSGSLSHRAAFNILFELRVQLMKKLARLSAGYFTGTTQGALKKVLQDDVEKIETFIAHNITDIVAAIALPVFTIGYLFIVDWRLALCTVFPLFVGIYILAKGMKNPQNLKTQRVMHETRKAMNSNIVEYVHGIPVIKVFNRTLSAFTRLGKSINDYTSALKKTSHFFAPRIGVFYCHGSTTFIYFASRFID